MGLKVLDAHISLREVDQHCEYVTNTLITEPLTENLTHNVKKNVHVEFLPVLHVC